MNKIKVALIGAGQRGKDVYGEYAAQFPQNIEFVAVAESNDIKRKQFAERHNINNDKIYESWEYLLQEEKFCDAVIIATPDDMHYEPTKKALNLGYHVLLEKPMSNNSLECVELGMLAKEKQRVFMICHVLRYTAFFSKIKEVIEAGEIGKVMSIQHNENIGYFHMAHSFVRGNWRNSKESSPIILAKSCHDMDIILYLVGDSCKSISSFGELSYFSRDNAPASSGERCINCSVEESCIYSAKKQYLNSIGRWPSTVASDIQSKEAILKALEIGPYGRCVYKCDNDVCDHQVTIMNFNNGVTATFNLSAFTNKVHRTIKIMGTRGEIRADDSRNEIEIQLFGSQEKKIILPTIVSGGHGGGDHRLMDDFVSLIKDGSGSALTSADKSVESHLMSFAAEKSRLSGKSIALKDLNDELMNKLR
ncbi:Gfo/Idh/MocA family protein [Alkaliphilus peptidifermentans]|uniref:Oxidoreductase family, C-terminal alpha/beta domain n=1 Tax=Alkaliphilus peptidifermentans DSM 18978 TaxID=1120976 RepID=A0A1G5FZJ5_9FIRM|nr:Gfo/Idh/MocA family oxidoreductase [Alkaliphilus peptidifermentans]SCY43998.1 Oxidoreductase family, C-terminal alpha/beta domain [Alkaliphilus peptidifermentans DSM 18978]